MPRNPEDTAINNVRRCRTQKGVKQLELAYLAKTAQSTISNVETGQIVPNVYLALRIARALQSSVEQLFPLPEETEREIEWTKRDKKS